MPSVYTKQVEIRWRDMDAFKHVNNAVYLTYLEEARDEWLVDALGNGFMLNSFVLARCAIDYRSSLTQDDGEVTIELRLARVGRSSIATSERMYAQSDGRLAAEAEAVMVHYDPQTGDSSPLPEDMAERFRRWAEPAARQG
jgi:acyl-CoA thioester hydrolase